MKNIKVGDLIKVKGQRKKGKVTLVVSSGNKPLRIKLVFDEKTAGIYSVKGETLKFIKTAKP